MKKQWKIVWSMIVVIGLLAGCSGGSGGSSGGEASGGKTVLTFWGDWGGEGQEQIQTMVDAFNKSQDKIEVKYALQQDVVTKFLTAATNGGRRMSCSGTGGGPRSMHLRTCFIP